MVFDAIITEFLRFIDDRNEDMENSDVRQAIALLLKSELLLNSHMGEHEFCEHASKRIIVRLVEMAREAE